MDIEQTYLKNAIATNNIPSRFHSPFAKQLDATLISLDLDNSSITCAFTVSGEYLHGGGVVQGGIIASMLDFAMAMLSLATIEDDYLVATTDLHTQFLKPAMPGRFTATAIFTRKGRTAHFCKADIENSGGIVVATAIATNMIIAPK
ncbi:PaaI family thioesterase [Kordiimonas aquimaris]|uniref:PaaI family thioesterase n=1 Tax=Kordiimonas aquimaris TaxID=707591 RepID=UPI0021D3A9F8|nr:PaaI family thioesterase [Kordiimonas aquimaris]